MADIGSRIAATRRSCLRAIAALVFALAAAGCATLPPAGLFLHAATPRPGATADRTAYNRRVFDDAWRWVGRRYYDERMNGVDWPAARDRHRGEAEKAASDDELYRAINALLEELGDSHTRARSPAAVAERRRNEGVLLGVRTGPLPGSSEKRVVLDVLPGSPAEDAGVLPGWILLRCDGRRPGDVLGVGKLADGQVVRCEFLDGDSGERVLDLAARPVSLRPVRKTAELAEGVVLLRFDLFDAASARWLRRELAAHAGAPGLVLDLRHNSGGTWAAMADILEAFFDEAVPIGTTLERAGGVKRHRVKPGWEGSRFSAPIVVLVSDRSASAAEIFAHVVQHHRRGTIVGAKTAGVVLASVEWRLPGGGELHLSLFDYRGADGRRLEGAGVAPDVVVDPPAAGRPGERDPAIAAALEVLGNGSLDPQPPAWGREMQPPTSGGG